MHLFLIRDGGLDALAHLHPIARTPKALDFDVALPALPPESTASTATSCTAATRRHSSPTSRCRARARRRQRPPTRTIRGSQAPRYAAANPPAVDLGDGTRLEWARDNAPIAAGAEQLLAFSVRDASGAVVEVRAVYGHDPRTPSSPVATDRCSRTSIRRAAFRWRALRKFAGSEAAHAAHDMPMPGEVAIPFAFPSAGPYRMWVQVKRNGVVRTAAFDVDVR